VHVHVIFLVVLNEICCSLTEVLEPMTNSFEMNYQHLQVHIMCWQNLDVFCHHINRLPVLGATSTDPVHSSFPQSS